MNANACFPKWIKVKHLRELQIPVPVMFGEYEFAFSVHSAIKRAKSMICNLELEIVDCVSHLLSVSKFDYINQRVLGFLKKENVVATKKLYTLAELMHIFLFYVGLTKLKDVEPYELNMGLSITMLTIKIR